MLFAYLPSQQILSAHPYATLTLAVLLVLAILTAIFVYSARRVLFENSRFVSFNTVLQQVPTEPVDRQIVSFSLGVWPWSYVGDTAFGRIRFFNRWAGSIHALVAPANEGWSNVTLPEEAYEIRRIVENGLVRAVFFGIFCSHKRLPITVTSTAGWKQTVVFADGWMSYSKPNAGEPSRAA